MLTPGAEAADPETGEVSVNGEDNKEEKPDGETGNPPTGD